MPIENEGQQAEPQPEEKGPPERAQVVVDLSEEEEDDAAQVAAPEDRKGRRQQARDFRRQKEEFERRITGYEQQMAELRGRVAAMPAQAAPAAQPGADPIDAEIQGLNAQYDALVLAIQSPGQEQSHVMKLVDQARKIEAQRRKLEIKQVMASEGPRDSGSSPDAVIRNTIEAEFPQIFSNEALRARANAEAADLKLNKGWAHNLATAREAAKRAMAAFGLGQKLPAPTDADRARYANTPSRAGANGGGTGNTYTPNRFEMGLAKAWTKGRKDITTDEEAWRAWSKETGNRRQSG